MVRLFLLACCAVACVPGAPPSPGHGDGGAATAPAWPKSGPPGREPDLSQAAFHARVPGGGERAPLTLDDFVTQVRTGPQATVTHLWLTVGNPNAFQAEAVLRLPIPPGAAVTRALLHVGADVVEGAFVGRDRARQIYRTITERRRDPALVTWSGSEWLEVTVFPVEKADRRTLELEWTEPTATRDGGAWYRLPVIAEKGREVRRPGRITVDGVSVEPLGRSWLPLAVPEKVGGPAAARGPGEPFAYAMAPAKVRPPEPSRLVVVAETSRAMTPPERRRQRAVLEALLDALPVGAGVTLFAVDWAIASVAENAPPADARAALDHLDGIPSAGALDLENALDVAVGRARTVGARAIVYLGRGVDDFPGDALAAPLRRMQEAGVSLVVAGGAALPIADAAALTGGESLPAQSPGEVVARVLAIAGRTPADLQLANVERFFPLETVTGETRWLARFVGAAPAGLARAEARDLEALWSRAHVAGTAGRDEDQGQRHRVVTPLTSILVLESNADYARWGIPTPAEAIASPEPQVPGRPATAALQPQRGAPGRPAEHLAAIFGRDRTVGNDATDVLGALIGQDIGEAHGVGGLGLVGTGTGGGGNGTIGLGNFGNFGTVGKGGGSGVGYGRGGGLAGRRGRAPDVVPGQATVRGSLDRELIRRIIRLHLNEVKYCYDQGQARLPALAGRVAVRFTIGSTGQVLASVLQASTLGDASTEACIVQAVRRWEFPRPIGGGIVVVSYPFNLVPGQAIHSVITAATPTVAPDSTWDKALGALRGKGEREDRVAKVAEILAAPTTRSPAVLAWWIVESHLRGGAPSLGACVLAANLLREAGQPHEAGRLLSEAGGVDLPGTKAEFQRWAAEREVARLTLLAARK